ncbi:hypothetical protein M0R88_16590 [Halorussus gelatinilyticus]|uniref:DUF8055 domain-containing protein n=1 Tax=Halorussus gelatinilyticus TaxID=2937524 RepID=A0A8U0IJ67_9EURY|nr:hypothetical protein [Halorussus gelatinilyticus]UPW00119.1 hypothetical protein M0R88_16590 [Halorussus gelatinilyticus]
MSDYRDRIEALAERAREDRREFVPPADSSDPDESAEERALRYCRDGVGEVVAVYVEARTGEYAPLDGEDMAAMEAALNDWLELYALCHGREIAAEFTVREVAETVIETRDVVESARLLTGVPERESGVAWRASPRNS